MNKPDFLYIGYPRTGSSWLFQQLIKHSQVFLPYCKEVNYFWGYNQPPKGDSGHINKRVQIYRDERFQYYKKHLKKILNWKRLLWDLHYIYGNRSQNWYYALFKRGKICGDISPNLTMITPHEIRRLYAELPDIKIILAFREPIDQLWSIVRHDLCTANYDLTNVSTELLNMYVRRSINTFPKYHECYEYWSSVIPSNQIYITFFERTMIDPAAHYAAVCDFLGLEAELSRISIEPVGKHLRPELTAEYENILVDEFRESVEILHRDHRFDLPSDWYNRYSYLIED